MVYIVLSLLLYTAAIMVGTIASRNANTNLVSAILNTTSAIVPVAVVLGSFSRLKAVVGNQRLGIAMAVLAGVLIALFTMSINKSYAMNKVAIVAPIVFGGSIFLSAILSYIFLKEKITPIQGLGLFTLAIGLGLIIYARATGK